MKSCFQGLAKEDCDVSNYCFNYFMTHYPIPVISKNKITKIGKSLKKDLPWDEERIEEYADLFNAAYDWRNSHYYPMREIRREAAKAANAYRISSISAGRLKRMASIRKKLRNTTNSLAQIQDLGGARIILDDVSSVNSLINYYRSGASRHELKRESDYISLPKNGGYRSHHFVMSYCGSRQSEIFTGRLIELQIRTRVQHAWATAVEAVGLYKGQDFKGGTGDEEWLRFFDLMASEMAMKEGCSPHPSFSDRSYRRPEIIELEKKLNVINTLRSLNEGFNHINSTRNLNRGSVILQFDRDHNITKIDSFSIPKKGADMYSSRERHFKRVNSVLIDLDRIENLRSAYPNYFLDVRLFSGHVHQVVKGYDPMFQVGW